MSKFIQYGALFSGAASLFSAIFIGFIYSQNNNILNTIKHVEKLKGSVRTEMKGYMDLLQSKMKQHMDMLQVNLSSMFKDVEKLIGSKFLSLEKDIDARFLLHEEKVVSLVDQTNGTFTLFGSQINDVKERVKRLERCYDHSGRFEKKSALSADID